VSEQQDKILVVDDDARLRSLLQRFLEEAGYTVKAVGDAEQMDRALSRELYSLMVLDLMLPGEDGLSICRRLREAENVMPIIMLTAKGDDAERIEGLDAGADDYLPKPFNPKELDARIRAVLRRHVRELPGAPRTTGEFAVLKALLQNPREPLTRDKLMSLARGREWSAMERSIDVQVSRLRRLLEDDPSKPRYIQTVWGVGYVFVPD